MTLECFEKVIKKDMIDPTNGKQLTAKDVIPLQRVRCTSNNEGFMHGACFASLLQTALFLHCTFKYYLNFLMTESYSSTKERLYLLIEKIKLVK